MLALLSAGSLADNSRPEQVPAMVKKYGEETDALRSDPALKLTWRTLLSIKYNLKYFEEIKMEMYAPVFSDTLKKLDGKFVEVEGYVIPLSATEYVLSASPYASCFFCGKASPASVMNLRFEKPGKKYNMDAFVKFQGVLQLNYDDPNEFYYALVNAKEP